MDPVCEVSVVIPNFNRGHLIGSAIESVLAQGNVECEVLVCDDGSTDCSQAVVESFDHPRVRWIPGSRSGGPSEPRNRGVALARGRWVAFLDSDDTWLPGKLEAQLGELERSRASACVTNAVRYRPGESRGDSDSLPLHHDLPETITLGALLEGNLVVTSSVVVARSDLQRIGGFPESDAREIYEDYAVWLRLAYEAPIRALPTAFVKYRDDQAASLRGTMGMELRCTYNALLDFSRWRRAQVPPVPLSAGEGLAIARRLARLISVRDMLSGRARRKRNVQ